MVWSTIGAGRCAAKLSYDVGFDDVGTLQALSIKGAMLAGAVVDLAASDIAILKAKADMVGSPHTMSVPPRIDS
jgi:xanthine dehydrogenase molybdopterin-binding subunit B